MRVVAGYLRGRTIEGPKGDATRPTTDKVREAMFNALTSMDVLHDARVVDLFAGSGALGIEALSRGARHCTFVENNRDALATLRRNIEHLNLQNSCDVISRDARGVLNSLSETDLVFADPPYGFSDWSGLFAQCGASLVIVESDRPIGDVAGFSTVREKRYGRTFVAFLQRDTVTEGTVEGT